MVTGSGWAGCTVIVTLYIDVGEEGEGWGRGKKSFEPRAMSCERWMLFLARSSKLTARCFMNRKLYVFIKALLKVASQTPYCAYRLAG